MLIKINIKQKKPQQNIFILLKFDLFLITTGNAINIY